MTAQNVAVELSYIEKNFRLNWSGKREKIKPILTKAIRTTISGPRLIEIIGEQRAVFIFKKIAKMKCEKKRFSVQDKGVLTVYVK